MPNVQTLHLLFVSNEDDAAGGRGVRQTEGRSTGTADASSRPGQAVGGPEQAAAADEHGSNQRASARVHALVRLQVL